MHGLLTNPLPSKVKVGSDAIRIATDFRIWVDIWRLIDDSTIDDQDKVLAIFALAFPRDGESPTPFKQALSNPEESMSGVIRFLKREQQGEFKRRPTKREKSLSGQRLMDWDFDAERIISDFQREYCIDLTSPNTKIHWWRFMALFGGLSDTSKIMEAIGIRAADLSDKKLSKEDRAELKQRKLAVMLPPRTKQEVLDSRRLRE